MKKILLLLFCTSLNVSNAQELTKKDIQTLHTLQKAMQLDQLPKECKKIIIADYNVVIYLDGCNIILKDDLKTATIISYHPELIKFNDDKHNYVYNIRKITHSVNCNKSLMKIVGISDYMDYLLIEEKNYKSYNLPYDNIKEDDIKKLFYDAICNYKRFN